MKVIKVAVIVLILLLAGASPSAQTTQIRVCDSGCEYTPAQLQLAINSAAATAGNVEVLLQEGKEYPGNWTLPVKADAGPTAWVTIRTGVNATGVVQALTNYPAAGIRVCQTGFVQDEFSCVGKNPYDAETKFAKLKASTNNAYAIRTVATGTGTPVSYYRLKWLDFHAQIPWAGNAMIGLLNETTPLATGRLAHLPHHFEIDQILLHGDVFYGQKRGIQADASNVSITNSFMYDVKAGDGTGGQVIWGQSSEKDILVQNNYLSGGEETFLWGGDRGRPRPDFTSTAGGTTTSIPLDRIDDLKVGQTISVRLGARTIASSTQGATPTVTTTTPHGYTTGQEIQVTGHSDAALNEDDYAPRITVDSDTTFRVHGITTTTAGTGGTVRVRATADIASFTGNTVNLDPLIPLPFNPESGSLVRASIVTKGITVRYNYLTHPESWRTDPIVPTPAITGAAQATVSGATLTAGTYAYRITARRALPENDIETSLPSTEVTADVTGTNNAVTITWPANAGATAGFRVYGRTAGGQDRYWTVAAGATSFTDTGTTGALGTPPTSAGKHQLKNTLEFKQGDDILVEYNIIERSWPPDQSGPCVLFTGTQQQLSADSAKITNVVFRYNVVRRCAELVQITGRDAAPDESGRAANYQFRHNLFYLWGSPYGTAPGIKIDGGGGSRRLAPHRAPINMVFDHNTIWGTEATLAGSQALYLITGDTGAGTESPVVNLTWTNNLVHGARYGFMSVAPVGGNTEGRIVGTGAVGGTTVFGNNVVAGRSCTPYAEEGPNLTCPGVATVESNSFTSPLTAIEAFRLKAGSPYLTAATDGTVLGANFSLLYPTATTGVAIAESGNLAGATSPVEILTTTLPNGVVGTVYSQGVSVTGGTGPYVCTVTTGTLPAGLTMSACTISGTPSTAGAQTFTVTATDAATTPASDTQVLTLTIDAAPVAEALKITNSSPLPTALLGSPYTATLVASGGVPPYKWARTSGTMINGLSFDDATGVISGTPTMVTATPRIYSFLVTDSNGLTAEKTLSLSSMRRLIRAERYAFTWGAFWIGEEPPSGPDVRKGDMWFDSVANVPKWATSVGPPVVWTAAAAGGGQSIVAGANIAVAQTETTATISLPSEISTNRVNTQITGVENYIAFTQSADPGAPTNTIYGRIFYDSADKTFKAWQNGVKVALGGGSSSGEPSTLSVTFLAGAAVSYSNAPVGGGEFPGASRNRVRIHSLNVTQCAPFGQLVGGAVADGDMRFEYWNGTAWADTGILLTLGASGGFKEGAWQMLAAGAIADLVTIRPFLTNGDGVADPSLSSLGMICK